MNRPVRERDVPPEQIAFMSTDQHESCEVLQPALAAYALGERELDAALRIHLAGCARCQQTLREYGQIARVLPYAAPEIAPPPELRERILALAAAETAGRDRRAILRPTPERAAVPPRRRLVWPGLALAGALMLGLLGWNLRTQSRLAEQVAATDAARARLQVVESILSAPDAQGYPLSGTAASGQVWVSAQRNQAYLVAQGLPEPGAGNVYQMWLIQGEQPVSAGTFETQAGRAATVVEVQGPLLDFGTFGVTVEPSGGSATPTSQPILIGVIESWTPQRATAKLVSGGTSHWSQIGY